MTKLIMAFMTAVLFFGMAVAGQTSGNVNITGEIVGECLITTAGIPFGNISVSAVSNTTASATWQISCNAPMTYTIKPDSLGNASLWTYNGGEGRNVATGQGTVWMTLTINGQQFPIAGIVKSNGGGADIFTIAAKLIPVGNYTGSVNQTIQPTLTW